MDERQNKMATMPEGKLLFGMAVPLMISMVVQALYNVVDSIYVSMISESALTAVSLAAPIQGFMIALAVGTGVGINSILSRRMGQKRYDEAEKVCSNAIFVALCSWIPFLIFGLFFSNMFISAFTNDAQIAAMGVDYISICCIYAFGVFIQIAMSRIMQAFGDSIFQMTVQGIGAITNIILDPIMIFGWLGFPKMGVAGAAVATVVGQILAMVIGGFLMYHKKKPIHVTLRRFKPDWKSIKDIYKVGLPSIIMQSITSITTIGLNMILMPLSTTAVAVYGIYFKLQNFVFMPVFGINNGLVPIVGFNYGAKNKERIMKTFKIASVAALCIMCMGTLCFALFPSELLMMFNAQDSMMAIGIPALTIISLSFPVAAISITFSGVFQAVGNGVYSMLVSITRQLLVILPVAYLFSLSGNIDSVWYSFLIAEAVAMVLSAYFFKKTYDNKINVMEKHND